jgi:hypothetical protein
LVSQLRETSCCAHHNLALGVFQQVFWCQLHTSETAIKLSGAVAREKEDSCKGERITSNRLLCYCFALFYFFLHHFIKNTKKLVPISSCFLFLA